SITGSINALSGSFTGTVNAATGEIGGWSIVPSGITSGSGSGIIGMISNPDSSHRTIFYAGGAAASAPYRVTSFGHIHGRTLVASKSGEPLEVYDYNDGVAQGSRIASFYR